MGKLSGIAPSDVFEIFEDICGIPRESGNLDAIARYCIGFAERNNYKWWRDKYNNVVIKKPATKGYEKSETIILQSHLDMVCEKKDGVAFDFKKDAIRPYIDGDLIRAEGTTLGGDNGIGVAMTLAILQNKELEHPSIEALLTADEETSMEGAFNLDCSILSGHRLINLDSEFEGIFMCSCAGGVDISAEIPVVREEFEGEHAIITISGLMGGHSGVEIDKGRANANIILARILKNIVGICRIVRIEGGGRDNAIPSSASAYIAFKSSNREEIAGVVASIGKEIRKEFISIEPDMAIKFEEAKNNVEKPFSQRSSEKTVDFLTIMPDGVQRMCPDITNLVQTSSNLGILSTEENSIKITALIRSSVETEKKDLVDSMQKIIASYGGVSEVTDDFPGWAFDPNSRLKELVCEAYKEVTGKEGKADAVHAGIECGLFSEKIPGLDCISIGPDMGEVHTPDEHLSISSTERTFNMLKAVLRKAI